MVGVVRVRCPMRLAVTVAEKEKNEKRKIRQRRVWSCIANSIHSYAIRFLRSCQSRDLVRRFPSIEIPSRVAKKRL